MCRKDYAVPKGFEGSTEPAACSVDAALLQYIVGWWATRNDVHQKYPFVCLAPC